MTTVRGSIQIIGNFNGSLDKAWETVCSLVRNTSTDVPRLLEEAMRYGAEIKCEDGLPLSIHAMEFAEGKSIHCVPSDDNTPEPMVRYAIGGNPNYVASMLHIVRAFERLMFMALQRYQIPVTIDTAHTTAPLALTSEAEMAAA